MIALVNCFYCGVFEFVSKKNGKTYQRVDLLFPSADDGRSGSELVSAWLRPEHLGFFRELNKMVQIEAVLDLCGLGGQSSTVTIVSTKKV